MRSFSKSKLMALRQCPKRLWLEIHHPQLREDSAATEASFRIGHQVGDIAQQIYDPHGEGAVIDFKTEGFRAAFDRTLRLMKSTQPVFEAGFSAGGALAFADVMVPRKVDGKSSWRMVEVKSSTSVKDCYRDDVAVQAFVARSSGVPLESIALAHIDNTWVYPGDGDYSGLLKEVDLTEEALARENEVKAWIQEAQAVAACPTEPFMEVGGHCGKPYACGFYRYCSRNETVAEYPVNWLPNFGAKAAALAKAGIFDMRDIPDDQLNEIQLRVKTHTVAQTVYFDVEGAAADLANNTLPAYFLDFETIQFAVPIWQGTRPYQFHTFQYSVHTLTDKGVLSHRNFLDLSGNDPAAQLALALVADCGTQGPVYVYNAAFETTRIQELADRFPDFREDLLAINKRVVDLLPIARERYYHPGQQGSWSIKKLLPAVVPELRHDALKGVQDGAMAMDAFLEAIHPDTSAERKAQIRGQLLAYCKLDTYAMVQLWQVFAGRQDLKVQAGTRTSGENFVDFLMAPSSQMLEPPQNPGRFKNHLDRKGEKHDAK